MPTTQNGDITLHYEVHGEGLPIVLGHSFLCSTAMWEPQVAPLAEHYQIINIDARGHGKSGPVNQPCTIYDMADDVVAVLDDLGLPNAVWGGLSIGGMVAMRAALKHPDRVRAMMLLDTDAGPEKTFIKIKYSAMGLVVKTIGFNPLRTSIAKLMFAPVTLKTQSDLVEHWKDQFASVHIPSILVMLKSLQHRDDLLGKLPSINIPALVLVGAQDQSLPPSRSKAIADALPNAHYVEVSDAGHLATLEQPETVTQAMLEFVQGLDA